MSSAARPREPAPGDVVLHYRVGERLGAGGMGQVYKALDTRLGREVALKFLSGAQADDPERRARLMQEAQAAALLRSPHVVVTHDIGEHDGALFIVMEYVEGTLVSERLGASPIPVAVAADLAMQVADALEEAHSYGIVHRDIKSANIIVTARGLAKVLDFGVAKFMPNAARPTDETRLQTTTPGLVLGTIAYMSPEQILAREVDHRSDLYSLGVVLFEMLTGRLPFVGDSVTEVADAIINREPPALARCISDVPEALEALVRKALRKDPAFRHQSARDLYVSLHDLAAATERPSEAPAPGPRDTTQARPAPEMAVPHDPTVAVMAFANITGDGTDAWIGSGIAETITTDLKAVHGLQIIGRARVIDVIKVIGGEASDGFDERLAIELGRRLRATWIVGGGYQRIGDRVRITGHVLDIGRGTLRRTVKIDGTIDDIFDLQDRLVYELSQSLDLTLDPAEQARIEHPETRSVEAYESYSRGMANLRSGDPESIERAMHLFEKATELDPGYAAAWAALGTGYDLKAQYLSLPALAEKAVELERHAIALDPSSANAHRWLAGAYTALGRHDEAIEELKVALRLDPDHAEAHSALGRVYWIGKGKIRNAIRLLQRGLRINPDQGYSYLQLAFLYAINGEYEKGVQVAREAIALQERDTSGREGLRIVGAHNRLGYLYYRQGRYAEAIAEYERELAYLASNDHALGDRTSIELYQKLAAAHIADGTRAEAKRFVDLAIAGFERRRAKGADDPFTKYYIAGLYALEGDRDRALRYLEESSAELGAINAIRARTDPDLASVRDEPRFQAIVGQAG